jgi:ribosomal protein S18 acetylase RimI-like enzyme
MDFDIIAYHPRFLGEVSALYGYGSAQLPSASPEPSEPSEPPTSQEPFDGDATEGFEAATDGEQIWLALKDGHVAGFAAYYAPDHFLHSLFVDPDLQRSGIGKALIEHVVRVHGPGYTLKVEKENTGAIFFYEHLSFTDVTPLEDKAASWFLLKSP